MTLPMLQNFLQLLVKMFWYLWGEVHLVLVPSIMIPSQSPTLR